MQERLHLFPVCFFFLSFFCLSASNLSFWNRLDPANRHIDGHDDDTNNPHGLIVVLRFISENDGEDDSSQIAARAREARHDSIGIRMHMGDEREVETVRTFEEESHADTHETH